MFFSSRFVKDRVDAATRKNLSKAGAYVRTDAKRSIRKRSWRMPPAPPGKPPFSRTGLLKKFIFFRFDPRSMSVVVGPYKLPKMGTAPEALEYGGNSSKPQYTPKQREGMEMTDKQRETLRYYGIAPTMSKYAATRTIAALKESKWRKGGRDKKTGKYLGGGATAAMKKAKTGNDLRFGTDGKLINKKSVYVRAHPYMNPALKRQASQMPRLWRNSVRGAV